MTSYQLFWVGNLKFEIVKQWIWELKNSCEIVWYTHTTAKVEEKTEKIAKTTTTEKSASSPRRRRRRPQCLFIEKGCFAYDAADAFSKKKDFFHRDVGVLFFFFPLI